MKPLSRKLIALLALILMLGSLLALPTMALELDPDTPADPIEPETPLIDLSQFYATIYINNSTGKATCGATSQSSVSSDNISLTMTLQRWVNGAPADVTSWSTSGTGSASLSKPYYVAHGYYYRTKAYAYVTTSGGAYVEDPTATSTWVYY